jgi:hypothetical protein
MWLIVVFVLASVCRCRGGFDQSGSGSRANALGGACTALAGDVWSASCNVAGLSALPENEISFFYSPAPFGLSELAVESGVVGIPTRFGVIGVAGRKFGYDLYREMTGTISYSFSIAPVGFGISLNYQWAGIGRYGSSTTLAADLGIRADLPGGLQCGMSIRNVNGAAVGSSEEPLPQICLMGIACNPAEHLLLAIDLHKQSGYEPSVCFGIEYRVIDAVTLRAGIPEAASACTAGVGIRFLPLRIDYDVRAHPELGWTHEMTFSVAWR